MNDFKPFDDAMHEEAPWDIQTVVQDGQELDVAVFADDLGGLWAVRWQCKYPFNLGC